MSAHTGHRKYRLLIVDDNRAIHEDFRKILAPDTGLEKLGAFENELFGRTIEVSNRKDFEIDSAYQGEQGLELVKVSLDEARPYSLAFVDMRMPPGWNGIETIERIWQVDPELQVVICSAYSDHSWAEISKRLDNSDRLLILKKPFDNVEILQMAYAMSRKCELARAAAAAGAADAPGAADRGAADRAALREIRDQVELVQASLKTLTVRLSRLCEAADRGDETALQRLLTEPGAGSDADRLEEIGNGIPTILKRLEALLEPTGTQASTGEDRAVDGQSGEKSPE